MFKISTTTQDMATQKERSSSNGSPGTTPTPPPASGLQTEEGTATRPRASSSETPANQAAAFDSDMMEKLFSFMSFYEQHQQGAPAQSNNSNNNNATPMSLDGSSYARGNQQQRPTFAPYEPQRGSVSFIPQPASGQERTLDALQVQSQFAHVLKLQTTKPFDGNDFFTWSFKFELMMEGAQILGFFDGSLPYPTHGTQYDKQQYTTPRRKSLQPNPTYAAIAQSEPSGKDTWFLDSCCGQHMCSSGRFVQREHQLQREVVITVANNQNLRTRRQGVVQLQSRETNVILQMSKGFIKPSTSPFVTPIMFMPKKDGGIRMCIDYRTLNWVTIKSCYPIPRTDDLLDQLGDACYFSKIELCGSYHQIRVFADDCHKTGFRTRYGSYEFTVMPFRLTNAPSTFQLTMNRVFHELLNKCVIVYLDNILLFSRTCEQHLRNLDAVFKRLQDNRFITKGSKCGFPLTWAGIFGAHNLV
ncbi:unnamed protein product [Closterium sp. NIES-54]